MTTYRESVESHLAFLADFSRCDQHIDVWDWDTPRSFGRAVFCELPARHAGDHQFKMVRDGEEVLLGLAEIFPPRKEQS